MTGSDTCSGMIYIVSYYNRESCLFMSYITAIKLWSSRNIFINSFSKKVPIISINEFFKTPISPKFKYFFHSVSSVNEYKYSLHSLRNLPCSFAKSHFLFKFTFNIWKSDCLFWQYIRNLWFMERTFFFKCANNVWTRNTCVKSLAVWAIANRT